MAVLEFILIVLLQFEGISAGFISPYHRVGDVVIFHCYSKIYSEPCSTINWLYDQHLTVGGQTVVQDGKVDQSSPRAARLSLSRNCSLIINNITAEDAGRYICQFRDKYSTDGLLNVLSISPSDVGPTEDGDVTLHCSLRRYESSCPENSLLWVDETGTQLTAEGDGYKVRGQTNCVSSLTVKHQNGRNRRFSCQFVEENEVKIEAHYPPVSAGSPLKSIMWTLRVSGLILMMGITVGLIRTRGCKKPLKDTDVGEGGRWCSTPLWHHESCLETHQVQYCPNVPEAVEGGRSRDRMKSTGGRKWDKQKT
ncbi:uncharacterized protein LOC108251247 isoform X2 [Kryptolebias marmoratus]|uniref:uncharacterized protein LOC108251247 isoform X2 n=1 Tax=Kryptolebias marmoratus TaxID=37003 RepID=UPI0018ACF5D0|nr:uncharacterized protein LOC108251247 isoform X2 [Kryptolebias marmoratus]